MPTYQYECEKCGHKFEVRRKMTESDRDLKCPRCGAEHPRRDFCGFSFSTFSFDSCSLGTKWASDGGG